MDKAQLKIQQAIALHQQGLLNQAQAIYEEVIQANPEHFHALNLLGMIAAQKNNFPKAIELFTQSIRIKNDFAEAYCNLGNVLQGIRQFEKAEANYAQAIAIKPDYPDAYFGRGAALKGLRKLEGAVASYDQAITLNPNNVTAFYNRGNVLKELGLFDAAIASYNSAIALRKDHIDAYYNRGMAYSKLKQFDAAIHSYDQAIALNPRDADAYYNRGIAYSSLGQLTSAIENYNQAIAIRPAYAEVYINRGVALKGLGRLDEALDSYNTAISLKPDNMEGHWNISILNLLRGDFEKGWEGYEWRWRGNSNSPWKMISQPLWLGKEPLMGKAILIHSEQGLGDTIQFCRYIKLLADLGAQVILTVPQPLVSLLSRLCGVSQIIPKGDELPPFDYHCPLLSLPLAFKTTLHTIPSPSQYLTSDATKIEQWQFKLPEKSKPRIGLVWSGSTTLKNDLNRSILLADLINHLPAGFQYISLQKEVREIDSQTLQLHSEILHFESDLQDFSDTAALCELMDVIISVDTSVAHLAGALGKPVFILLPFDPDWRWLLDRTDSPWYSSAILYRQRQIGDWKGVLNRVAVDLIQALNNPITG